ncbi:hypothetical protein [Nostoc favosum]|uniref:hypothetical protein n=1 Tax=Nostoc favosum TaxID=2907819 RepID=UPI001E2AC50B|nr:hypothetical protein [Nostoc favosum]
MSFRYPSLREAAPTGTPRANASFAMTIYHLGKFACIGMLPDGQPVGCLPISAISLAQSNRNARD